MKYYIGLLLGLTGLSLASDLLQREIPSANKSLMQELVQIAESVEREDPGFLCKSIKKRFCVPSIYDDHVSLVYPQMVFS